MTNFAIVSSKSVPGWDSESFAQVMRVLLDLHRFHYPTPNSKVVVVEPSRRQRRKRRSRKARSRSRSRSKGRSRSRTPARRQRRQRRRVAREVRNEVAREEHLSVPGVPHVAKGALENLGKLAGGVLDPLMNGVFDVAGNFFGGSGDYVEHESTPPVAMNTILHPTLAESVPSFGAEDGHVLITHREFIQDVIVSGTATDRFIRLTINPGDAFTFPWLSALATNFEQYRLLGCVFEFVSTSTASTVNANPALWTIAMATQYNVNQRDFAGKRQILNHFFSSSGVASDNVRHMIECREELTSVTPKYIRTGTEAPTTVSDARMMDVGRFTMLVSGGSVQPVAQTLGELHVTYHVALLKPRLASGSGFTYDPPDNALPDPGPTLVHIPEIEALCCHEEHKE